MNQHGDIQKQLYLGTRAAILAACLFSYPLSVQAAPVRGMAGDLWADTVLGQPDFFSDAPNQTNEKHTAQMGGVYVDRSDANGQPDRMFIWDALNNRVLVFNDIAHATAGNGADAVLGQPNFNSTANNGDSNFTHYPNLPTPSANTISSTLPNQISQAEGGSFANMATDSQGNLYVPDFFNNRILRYNNPGAGGFTSGQAAAYQWGQPGAPSSGFNTYYGNNNGVTQTLTASNSTLCLYYLGSAVYNPNQLGAGVAIDSVGNLWVADTTNDRVLRFPSSSPGTPGAVPSSTADVVLGQNSFTETLPLPLPATSNDKKHLRLPIALRVDNNGNVYVVDLPSVSNGLQGRVVVYQPDSFNGGQYSYTSGKPGSFVVTQYLSFPHSIELDSTPAQTSDPTSGGFWVTDSGTQQVLLYDYLGNFKKVLLADEPSNLTGGRPVTWVGDGQGVANFTDNYQTSENATNLGNAAGAGVGVDTLGNVYVPATEQFQDIWQFPAPIPTPVPGIAHEAKLEVLKPDQFGVLNEITTNSMYNPAGVAVYSGTSTMQLIVSDQYRLLFWNMPTTGPTTANLPPGKAPDGIAGYINPYGSSTYQGGEGFERIVVDNTGTHLWAIVGPSLMAFNLPLTSGATAAVTLSVPINVLGGGTLSWDTQGGVDGIASDSSGNLWVVDRNNNRAFRIRNPLTSPQVDVVLGQSNYSNSDCNYNGSTGGSLVGGVCNLNPSSYGFTQPGSVSVDSNGFVYVSDHSLEGAGNNRLLAWSASTISNAVNAASPNYAHGIPADLVYGTGGSFTSNTCDSAPYRICSPLGVALTADSKTLVAGMDPYDGSNGFPGILSSPETGDNPVSQLKDYYTLANSFTFDNLGNLYAVDSNKYRVLVYLKPFQVSTTTVTPVPTCTSTYTPTPVGTPTPTPTITSTPDFSCPKAFRWLSYDPYGLALDSQGNVYVADNVNNMIEVYGPNGGAGAPIARWAGSGSYAFGAPNGLAVYGNNIYVVDYSDNMVDEFTLNGTPVAQWGSSGSGNSQFLSPWGIAVNSTGTLVYVADWGNDRVEVFDGSGNYVTQFNGTNGGGELFQSPTGIAVDNQGNVYVTDYDLQLVQVFSSTGVYQYSWSTNGTLQGADFISIDNITGWVYVSDGVSSVAVYSEQGLLQGVTSGFSDPEGVVANNGTWFVAEEASAYIDLYGSCNIGGSPTIPPTSTYTGTPTLTLSNTPTGSSTPTPTNTPTGSATFTPTYTFTLTDTPTGSATPTPSNTPTGSATPTPTNTPTGSATPTPTYTFTLTDTPTGSATPTPSNTPTGSATPTPTNTPTGSATPTPTYTFTLTDTPTGSATPTPSNTPTGSATPTPTNTPTGSATPTPTYTFTLTDTPTGSATPTPSNTPTGSATPTPTNTPTGSATSTPTNTFTLTNTPTGSATPTFTPTKSYTPANTFTFTSTWTFTNTPTRTFTPTKTGTSTFTSTKTNTPTITRTPTKTGTPTKTFTPTHTGTKTFTPTKTNTATITRTPTKTFTPTFTFTKTNTQTFTNTPTLGTPTPTCCTVAMESTPLAAAGMSGIWGVGMDAANQRVLAADPISNQLWIFNTNGSLYKTIPGLPQVEVAVTGPSGDIYAAMNGTTIGILERFDSTGTTVKGGTTLPGPFRGIQVDGSGNIYFALAGTNVAVYNGSPTPTPIATLTGLSNPTGLWVNGNKLYVSDTSNSRIVSYTGSNGVYSGATPVISGLAYQPTGLWQDPAGNYYVGTLNGYAIYDKNWNPLQQCSRSELGNAAGLAVDPSGAIYVASTGNTKLVKMTGCANFIQPTLTSTPSGGTPQVVKGVSVGSLSTTYTPTPSPTVTVTPTPSSTAGGLVQGIMAAPNLSRNSQPIQFHVTLGGAAKIQLTLVNLMGEMVYQQTLMGSTGLNTINWDLKNKAGTMVSSGLYVYAVRIDNGVGPFLKIGKVAVFR